MGGVWVPTQHVPRDSARHAFTLGTSVDEEPHSLLPATISGMAVRFQKGGETRLP